MKGDNDMTDLLEKRLKEQVGKENPFRVPEGYFSTLPDKVCVRIARKQRERRMWRWAAAAVMAGCVATASLLLVRQSETSSWQPRPAGTMPMKWRCCSTTTW